MKIEILSYVLWAFAALMHSVRDTIEYHFKESVFWYLSLQPNGSCLYKIFIWLRSFERDKYRGGRKRLGRKKLFWRIPVPNVIIDGKHTAKNAGIAANLTNILITSAGASFTFALSWTVFIYLVIWFVFFEIVKDWLLLQSKHRRNPFDFIWQIFKYR